MKILAIRGKSLASLVAPFEVDFQAEPLASSGLFAITGHTGAGKSTLLDALCLALYERTPRLSRATAKGLSVPDVGDNAVAPGDPRTLLSRRAAEGFAEVDFVGNDGGSYRARWSVRRARNKPDGKLQPSEVSLRSLPDEQVLGDHTKTDTLRQIEARVGLNFDQFTRAVLLAQNDFAAFLRASDDERAELLQTLTGTDEFKQLSIRAHERAKAERAELDQLKAQLQAFSPWPDDVRALNAQHIQAHQAALAQQAQQRQALEVQLHWHERTAQLQAQVQTAEQALAQAQAAVDEASPRQQALADLAQLQAARPLWDDTRQLAAALAQAEAELARVAQQLNAARTQRDASAQAQREAEVQWQAAEQAHTQAQPELAQAAKLDARLELLAPQAQSALQLWQQAEAEQTLAQTAHQAATQRQSDQQATLAQHQQWLAEHTAWQPLAEGWPRWQALLEQAASTQRHIQEQELKNQSHQAQEGALAFKSAAASTAVTLAQEQGAAEQQQLAHWAEQCAAHDAAQLSRQRSTLGQRLEQAQSAQQLAQALVAQQQRLADLSERAEATTQRLAHSAQAGQAAQAALPLLEAVLAASRESLDQAKLAASEGAARMRAQLRPGHACPVCGAPDHPWGEPGHGETEAPDAAAHSEAVASLPGGPATAPSNSANSLQGTSPVQALLQGLQKLVADKLAVVDACKTKIVAAKADQVSDSRIFHHINTELQALQTQWHAGQAQWLAHPIQADAPLALQGSVPTPGATPLDWADWLAHTLADTRHRLAQLADQEASLQAATAQRDAAQQRVNQAQQAQVRADKAHTALAQELASVAQSLANGEHHLQQLNQQLQTVLAQLAPPLSAIQPAPTGADRPDTEQPDADQPDADQPDTEPPGTDRPDTDQPGTDWPAQWRADPDGFSHRCQQGAQAWLTRHTQSQRLEAAVAQLVAELKGLGQQLLQARALRTTRLDAHTQAQDAWQTQAAQRQALLQGRSVAQVQAELTRQQALAKAALEQAGRDLHAAEQAHTRLGQSQHHAQEQLQQRNAEADKAALRLGDWLEAFNHRTERPALTHTELEKALAVPATWLADEQTALQALDAALAKAQTVLDTHRQSASAHQIQRPAWTALPDGASASLAPLAAETGGEAERERNGDGERENGMEGEGEQEIEPPYATHAIDPDDPQSLKHWLGELSRQAQTLTDELAELRHAKAQDEQRQRDSTQLRTALDAQAAREQVWSRLGELIGSADGKKFRNFAQQQTLDVLLSYANQHLQDLSRRYRLERIADSLALLVVDQDMGDEVRSVHSLSGGESFLVSLALALGLASLSSHRVRVESLFIDEGFGSLDAEALQVAMDALDNLQALGRKVGVISHVQEMTERIATRVHVRRMAGGLSRVVVG